MGEIARVLSDSLILPFNTTAYSTEMYTLLKEFKSEYGTKMDEQKIDLKPLEEAINNFTRVSNNFEERLKNIDKTK